MAERLSLAGEWSFAGFHGEDWRWRGAFKRDTAAKGWLPGTVPGSVHWDLLKLGEIPDPYFERNSRACEWVHQRQWVYKRDFTVPAGWAGRRLFLQFDGIDYESEVYLDGELLGTHDSMFVPARFELTGRLKPGESHHLAVVLLDAPREWPQLGRTSTVHTQKARFGYWWDFATRLVHLGIWQDVFLQATGDTRIDDVWVRTDGVSTVDVAVKVDGPAAASVEILDSSGKVVASGGGRMTIPDAQLWWTNWQGAQPLYTCRVTVPGDSREVTFGIRRFTLEQNPWPPAGAPVDCDPPLPYTFTVNGERLFVKGWNWVPVDHMYGRNDLTERYTHLIRLAKESGCNLIRVWGGGLLERELFYDLCDRAGIMVWQEFFQSSSGTDNVPPTDPAFLARIEREAEGVIPLRRNHPSLVVWCGGNELTDWEKNPATLESPALSLLARKVAELDPDRPYYPTSPTGPSFGAPDHLPPEKAAHLHDVHGPWHYRGPVDSYLPYNASTALFHSEFGTQGAPAKSSLDRNMSPDRQWPPNDTNPLWVHHGGWWMQQHRVRELFGETIDDIETYWHYSQYLQAENLRYGVESNRRRWPVNSGTIIWQFDEPWPNSHCTTCVDYYLRPKMAYYYVKQAYAPVTASLRYEGPIIRDGILRVEPHVIGEAPFRLIVTDVSGRIWHVTEAVEPLAWALPPDCPDVVIVTLWVGERKNPYLFTRTDFRSLREGVASATVAVRREGSRVVLANQGSVYAFFPAVDIDDARYHWVLSDNYPLLAPGEEFSLEVSLIPRTERADTDFPHGRPAPEGPVQIRVTGWNMAPVTLAWEV